MASARQTAGLRAAALALLVGTLAWHGFDLATGTWTDRAGRLKGADFLQFYTYGVIAATDGQQLYEPAAHQAVARTHVNPALSLSEFRPNYPPVVAWLARPLARLPFLTALGWFSVLSLALYLGAVALLAATTVELRHHQPLGMLLAVACPTLFVVLRYGQISALSLLVVTCSVVLAAKRRDLLAGTLLGLLVFKPTLVVVPALAFAVCGKGRLLAGLIVGILLETSVNVALVGIEPMRQYFATLAELVRRPELVQFFPAESHSLRGFVRLLAPVPGAAQLAGWVGVVIAVASVVRVWKIHDDWRPRWSGLVLATLVGSPHLLSYDLLLLAVPIVLLADWLLVAPGSWARRYRIPLAMAYFAAWPGTFIARLYLIQPSTIAMLWLLALLARRPPSAQS
jgi:alpha-1,2-mannosyltransferase